MTIKAGDVVCKRTGGFLMTVEDANSTHAACAWFDSGKGPFRAVIPLGELDRWDPKAHPNIKIDFDVIAQLCQIHKRGLAMGSRSIGSNPVARSYSEKQTDRKWLAQFIGKPCYSLGCPTPASHAVEYGNGSEDGAKPDEIDASCLAHAMMHPCLPYVLIIDLPKTAREVGAAYCCYIPPHEQLKASVVMGRFMDTAEVVGEALPWIGTITPGPGHLGQDVGELLWTGGDCCVAYRAPGDIQGGAFVSIEPGKLTCLRSYNPDLYIQAEVKAMPDGGGRAEIKFSSSGTQEHIGCPKAAEWNIHDEKDPHDATTQSCTEHVGHMLSGLHNHVWAIATVLIILIGGCFSGDPYSGKFLCSSPDMGTERCPPDWTCAADNYCYKPGDGPKDGGAYVQH